jgi:putative hydrolase of the HAD superfamily
LIKAVIFDLGRVIIPFDFHPAYAMLESRCGVPKAQIPELLAQTNLVQRFESGEIESHDFVRQISAHLNLDLSYEGFCEIWSSIFSAETLIPEEMLRGIARTYRLVLLSNTNAIHFEMIQDRYPHIQHFHALVLSYKAGALKPQPLIYQKAIEAAGCLPRECFFTDDIKAYVEAACALGIDAVEFQSVAQVERELRNRGVNWNNCP